MKINYRPEIDGLRAIAVLSVILYHAQLNFLDFQPFKGGFIGVDIFFVISGYLISSIIIKEYNATGNFSLKYFYERRIRRILPVLFFIIIVSFPIAWRFLLPSGFIDYSKSTLYSLFFSSNFYFHFDGLRYGAADGIEKPFLHTWSLSVEEQYYLIFPIFFLFLFRNSRKNIFKILIMVFIISLLFAELGSKNFPSANFYFIHARIFELIAGSILAYLEINKKYSKKYNFNQNIASSLGIILILLSILFFNDKMYHPSFYTLIPVIGVCLVIFFAKEENIIKKILSIKILVGIGLISYSLYLWHYPFFAFARITEITPKGSILIKVFFGIIIFVLSVFTYYFIEKPARKKNYNFKTISKILIFSALLIVILNFSVIFFNGYEKRLPEFIVNNLKVENPKISKINNSNKNKNIYLVGDSHMQQLSNDLSKKLKKNNLSLQTYTVGGCLFYPGFNKILLITRKIHKDCNNDYFLDLQSTLLSAKDSIIIFGGRLTLHLTNELFDNKEGGVEQNGDDWGERFIPVQNIKSIETTFKNSIKNLSKSHKIILIYPIPEVGWNLPRKAYLEYVVNKKEISYDNFITTSYQVYKDRNKKAFNLLDSIKGNNIFRIYPHKIFCNTVIKDRCITHDKKNIYYSDDDHTSITGSKMINKKIIEQINKL